MEIFISPGMTDEKRLKMLDAAEKILSEPNESEPDDPEGV
jgi:hypothetical protein